MLDTLDDFRNTALHLADSSDWPTALARTKQLIRSSMPKPLRRRVLPRRFHAFGVGAEKTGTTSLSKMFETNYRGAHDALWSETVAHIHAHWSGRIDREELGAHLAHRDRRLWVEMESSCLLGWHADLLHELHPDARFILTIRDCRDWLRSAINEHLKMRQNGISLGMHQWYTVAYEPHSFEYRTQDLPLLRRGLPSLDSFFSYWNRSIDRVVSSIPAEKLLVLKTPDITSSIDRIAQFVGVEPSTIDASASHRNRRQTDSGVHSELDPDYIEARAEALCSEKMARYFHPAGS